jgi:methyltransferase-like protein
MRKGTRIGQHERIKGNRADSEHDRIEGNRQINTNSRLRKNLEDHCKVYNNGLIYIQTKSELVMMLSQAFEKLILWKEHTRSHPMIAGAPQTILEFL